MTLAIDSGVPCVKCGALESRVIDSRQVEGFRRRRRVCNECDFRWSTVEMPYAVVASLSRARRAAGYLARSLVDIERALTDVAQAALSPDDRPRAAVGILTDETEEALRAGDPEV